MTDTEQIKQLREATSASIAACKEALEKSGGDFEAAKKILAERGATVAEKKASRETRSGIVDAYIHGEGRIGAMLELLCETDFVAKNEVFVELSRDIAMHIAAMNPQDTKELLAAPFVKDESITVQERIEKAIGVLGENIQVGNFIRYEL